MAIPFDTKREMNKIFTAVVDKDADHTSTYTAAVEPQTTPPEIC